ncbi:MAG: alpha-E domain-containing protein, partial [Pseudomonas sp.]
DDPLALQAAVTLADELSLLPEEGTLPERVRAALADSDWAFSLRANLQRLQWAASQVRGKLSRENWQALVELQRESRCLENQAADFGEHVDVLNRLVMSMAALSGFALDDMTRDEGWRFLMIGRRIERLQSLCSSLAVYLRGPTAFDQAGLEWLLELGNSSITYRSRYLAVAQLIPVLDLLLLDEQNPHAVLFQLNLLVRAYGRLSKEFASSPEPALALLAEQLKHFDLRSLEDSLFGTASVRAVLTGLADLLQSIATASGEISERLALRHFAHVDDVSQQTVSV